MKIGHVALWTDRLEEVRSFYVRYFGGESSEKYVNAKKGFQSYFIRFAGETSLEVMSRTDVSGRSDSEKLGLCHFSFTIGTRDQVDALTERFRTDGYRVLSEPRLTGDGFYESAIADPDGNWVELAAGE